jgi:hypothetical protein
MAAVVAYSIFGCGEYNDVSRFNSDSNGDSNGDESEVDQIKFYPPSNLAKEIKCNLEPVNDSVFKVAGKYREYAPAELIDYKNIGWEGRLAADWDALNVSNLGTVGVNIDNALPTPSKIPENVRVAVIDIRNVAGIPHYYYYSNETAFAPIEQWSITKFLGVQLSMNHLRETSNGLVGADSFVDGVGVGSYITSIGRISDNPTAAWFKSLMGAEKMTDYLSNWMLKSDWDYHRGSETIPEIFLGKYGQQPASYGGDFPLFESTNKNTFRITRNNDFPGSNTLSPLTMVESLKRLVVNDEGRYSMSTSLTDNDLEAVLYGAKSDKGYGGFLLGGTKSFSVDAFGGKEKLDFLTNGKWRIFGKTGSGYSSIRQRYEGVFLGSICLPKAKNGLRSSRQLVFMVNAQAKDSTRRWEIRYETLRNIANLMIPELELDL